LDRSTIDLVISVEVIEHLKDDELSASLGEIYSVLKPEGYLVVTTPHEEDLGANKTICPECGCIFNRWQHLRKWSVANLKETMERANFKTVHISKTVFGSRPKRLFYFYRRLFAENFIYPHLIYIGRK